MKIHEVSGELPKSLDPTRILFWYFYAAWNSVSAKLKEELKHHFEMYPPDCDVCFVEVSNPRNQTLCCKLKIKHVPSAKILTLELKELESLDNFKLEELHEKIQNQSDIFHQNYEVDKVRAFSHLEKLLGSASVIILNDKPIAESEPAKSIRNQLQSLKGSFKYINVTQDEKLNRWINTFLGKKSMPVLFVRGKFYCAEDQLAELSGNQAKIKEIAGSSNVTNASVLTTVLSECPAILFLRGNKARSESEIKNELQEGKLEESKNCALVGVQLEEGYLFYRTVNIEDHRGLEAELKAHLQTTSELSYPVLVYKGKLVAYGEDLVSKSKDQSFFKQFDPNDLLPDKYSEIKRLINSHPVVVFMKGSPSSPECGFTGQVVDILEEERIDYKHVDIIAQPDVRELLKVYANWKTYPQIYVKGELIGGLDIVREMIEDGSFQELMLPYKRK